MRIPVRRSSLGLLGLGLAVAVPLRAQRADSVAPPGTISGVVLAADSDEPLGDADLTLAPAPAGLFGGAATWRDRLIATTDDAGRYRFVGVPAGRYTLRVRRLGYHPASIDVDFENEARVEVSVGLVVAPITLAAIAVTAPATPTYHPSAPNATPDRADVERLRQQRYLTSDARVMTADDVRDAVTLGESDLFRALQRLPGVATRDDYTAELWARGAPWNQTRVTMDGLPLFNPVHAVGAFSGVDPDAIGTAVYEPGVRSASLGGGSAASVDLTSRRGDTPHLEGAAELSVVSARAAAGESFADGRGGWMLAARRSYVDLVTAALQGLGADSAYIPYAFQDAVARLDVPLGRRAALEMSALLERDDVRGNVRDLLVRSKGHWGNALARATLVADVGGAAARTTVGFSRFSGVVQAINPFGLAASATGDALALGSVADSVPGPIDTTTGGADSGGTAPPKAVYHGPTNNTVTYFVARTALTWGDAAGAPAWRVGFGMERFGQAYRGPEESPYPEVPTYDSLTVSGAVSMATGWVERRVARGAVAASVGARVEAGPSVENGGRVRVAPRAALRIALGGETIVSAGFGRTFQYVQSVAPAGPSIGPELHLTDVWLAATDTVPAIRSDLATVGAERWLSPEWLLSATAYVRRSTGVTVPDPTPDTLRYDRPLFAVGTNLARGVEIGVRRFAGHWTLGLAYTRARSDMDAGGRSYSATNDRREMLNVDATLSASRALTLSTVVTIASGAPYTRETPLNATCTDPTTCIVTLGEPNAERAPAYASASIAAEWAARRGSWDLDVYAQVRNVLPWRSAVTYAGTASCEVAIPPYRVDGTTDLCDQFDRGLPVLPLVGIRVEF